MHIDRAVAFVHEHVGPRLHLGEHGGKEAQAPLEAPAAQQLNPLAGIFDLYRSAFFPDEWAGWDAVGVAALISFGMLAIGITVFRRLEGAVLKEI